tara:strand:- start:434 stop:1009 length:576 start_codon:yes stop_codon:yes gene_type:complete
MKTLVKTLYDQKELDKLKNDLKNHTKSLDDILYNHHVNDYFKVKDLDKVFTDIDLTSREIINEMSYDRLSLKVDYNILNKIAKDKELNNTLIDNTISQIENLLQESEAMAKTGADFEFFKRDEIINFDYDLVIKKMKVKLPLLKEKQDSLALTKLEISAEGLRAIESAHLTLYNVLNSIEKIVNDEETLYA